MQSGDREISFKRQNRYVVNIPMWNAITSKSRSLARLPLRSAARKAFGAACSFSSSSHTRQAVTSKPQMRATVPG